MGLAENILESYNKLKMNEGLNFSKTKFEIVKKDGNWTETKVTDYPLSHTIYSDDKINFSIRNECPFFKGRDILAISYDGRFMYVDSKPEN